MPDVALPGSVWSGIVKSGGNDYHGDIIGTYEPSSFQAQNLDAFLRSRGVTGVGNQLNYIYDAFVDMGGRLLRDKLWFYGAWRQTASSQREATYFSNTILGPNGLQGNGIQPLDNHPITDDTIQPCCSPNQAELQSHRLYHAKYHKSAVPGC